MNTLGQHHGAGTKTSWASASRFPVVLVVGLVFGAAGCSQTTTKALTDSSMSGPVVLDSAGGGVASADPLTAGPSAATVPPSASASTPAPATASATPLPTAPKPAGAPAAKPASATAAAEPLPTSAPALVEPDDGQFPNINQRPPPPAGTLLPAEERARIISELEALRTRQTAPAGSGDDAGSTSDLASQATTHGDAAIKQIEACSEDGALENNPDCAPAD